MSDTVQATQVTVFSHKTVEYFTPEAYVDAARAVMGGIDLDPASHDFPQGWIQASQYYTKKHDGLTRTWHGRVWLNPPYSKNKERGNRSNQAIWSERLIDQFKAGSVSQAVLLVKAALGYKWFEALFAEWPVCFTRERIRFLTLEGQMPRAKQANAFFYFGERVLDFKRTFEQFGRVVLPERLRLIGEVESSLSVLQRYTDQMSTWSEE